MRWEHAFAKFPRRLSRGDEPDDAPTPHALSNSSRAMLDEAKSGNHDVHPYLADALEEGDNYADEDTLHLLRDHDYPQDRVHLYEHSPGKIRAVDEDDPEHPLNKNPESHPVVGQMIPAYMETALWSSMDDSDEEGGGGEPMDANYGVDDIHPNTRREMAADVADFYKSLSPDVRSAVDANPEQAGRDFWLTRNGHGSGFWDREYPNHEDLDVSRHLSDAAETHGSQDLYVGDDGMIYS